MTTSIRSGAADSAIQYNGIDQLVFNGNTAHFTTSVSAANATVSGQLVTYDQVIGVGQTWQNGLTMVPARAFSTTYTNTTGKPIEISIAVQAALAACSAQLYVNGNMVGRVNTSAANADQWTLTAIVPDGQTYSVTPISMSLIGWWELR